MKDINFILLISFIAVIAQFISIVNLFAQAILNMLSYDFWMSVIQCLGWGFTIAFLTGLFQEETKCKSRRRRKHENKRN